MSKPKHQKIDYSDIHDIGGFEKVEETFDADHFDKYGKNKEAMVLELPVANIQFEWEFWTRKCWMYRMDEEGKVEAATAVYSLYDLKDKIQFYKT